MSIGGINGKKLLFAFLFSIMIFAGCGSAKNNTEGETMNNEAAKPDVSAEKESEPAATKLPRTQPAKPEQPDEAKISYARRAVINTGNTGRISKLMERAENGEEITVGFIGGSITMGSGASSQNTCYAKLVYDWWRDTYPDAKFNYVNAGIGATTSQFACARAASDLLAYNPDFVVVEFSVNDTGNSFFAETYESLLRMIIGCDTEPAVMILNMVQYDNGVNAQTVHNEIGKYYDLPAVSMKESIYAEISSGRLKAEDVSSDNLHPNDRGHSYGAEIITDFLETCRDGGGDGGAYVLKEPLSDIHSMTSTRHDNRNSQPVCNGFVKDERTQTQISDVFRNGYYARDAESSIVFSVYGSSISLQYRRTNRLSAPKAVAIVDADEEKPVALDGNFENGWGDWLYLADIYKGENGPHTVEVRITEAGEKNDFYLVSVITTE